MTRLRWNITYVDDPGRGGMLLSKYRKETIRTEMWLEVNQ